MPPLNGIDHMTAAQLATGLASGLPDSAVRPRGATGCYLSIEPALKAAPANPHFVPLAKQLSATEPATFGARAFALTSARRGDGVTFTVRSLASALAQVTEQKVLIVDAELLGGRLGDLDCQDAEQTTPRQSSVFSIRQCAGPPTKWELRHVTANLELVSRNFQWVLIDCPSLHQSDRALALAPHLSGLLLVVAAEKTKRSEISAARVAIELSSGTLLGFVLNKRTSPVPSSLYHRLSRGPRS